MPLYTNAGHNNRRMVMGIQKTIFIALVCPGFVWTLPVCARQSCPFLAWGLLIKSLYCLFFRCARKYTFFSLCFIIYFNIAAFMYVWIDCVKDFCLSCGEWASDNKYFVGSKDELWSEFYKWNICVSCCCDCYRFSLFLSTSEHIMRLLGSLLIFPYSFACFLRETPSTGNNVWRLIML